MKLVLKNWTWCVVCTLVPRYPRVKFVPVEKLSYPF